MVNRIGKWLLLFGFAFTAVGGVITEGNIGRSGLDWWVYLVQGGLLAVSLGAFAIALDPETASEALLTTVLGMVGQVGLSIGILLLTEPDVSLRSLPEWPHTQFSLMAVGYLLAALHTIPDVSRRQSLTALALGLLVGLLAWIGPFWIIINTYETGAEEEVFAPVLFLGYVILLLVDLIGGTALYALSRAPVLFDKYDVFHRAAQFGR